METPMTHGSYTPTRRSLLKTGGVAALGLLAAPAIIRQARAATTLTVASLMGPDRPESRVWGRIGEIVEEKLPGAFTFNVVSNAALGAEKEVAQAAKLGSVQASLSTISLMSTWVPEAQIFDLPFLFRDSEHLIAATKSTVGAGIKAKLADQGFIVPAFIDYGARQLLTKTPIASPGLLKGLKMRVIQSPLHMELWSNYGANPTGIPIVEAYNALQTGVVDCMDLTKSAYVSFKLYEVVPFMTETAHIRAAGVIYFAQAFWTTLSDEQKQVLGEAAIEGAAYFNDLVRADEDTAMAQAAGAGAEVIQPTDMDAWVAGAKPVWKTMADTVGGMDRIDMIRELS